MICPKCEGKVRVIDSVHTNDNEEYRKRRCLNCGHTFYTAEYMVFANEEYMEEWREAHRKNIKPAEKK